MYPDQPCMHGRPHLTDDDVDVDDEVDVEDHDHYDNDDDLNFHQCHSAQCHSILSLALPK